MGTAKWEDPLEGLLTEALASAPLGGAKKRKGGLEATRHERAFFSNPENWNLVGQVQLVHVEANVETLIGLFDELRHVVAADARRLVAATTARECSRKIERVTGIHWLGDELSALKHQPVVRQVPLIVPSDLAMGQLLHAAPVLATAHLSHGGMTRLTLDEATLFEGHAPREILSLPKGIDVLEGLSGECKRNVWACVNIELNGEANG